MLVDCGYLLVIELQVVADQGLGFSWCLQKIEKTTFFVMMRFTSIILLSVYGLVSFLGHAGFDVLGLHSHGRVDAECAHSGVKCCHCHHGHKAVDHSEDDSPTSSGHPSDCSICKCFFLIKTQAIKSPVPTFALVSLWQESYYAYQRLIEFDSTFLPRPRGPPALQV